MPASSAGARRSWKRADADEYGDDRVDEGVGGDLGDGDVLQQVGVGGEADDRAEDGEIERWRGVRCASSGRCGSSLRRWRW